MFDLTRLERRPMARTLAFAATAALALAPLTSCRGDRSEPEPVNPSTAGEPSQPTVDAANRDSTTRPEPDDDGPIIRSGRALLIGVGNYQPGPNGEPSALRGPRHDVQAMRDLLIEHAHIPAGAVETLEDEQATLDGIVKTFRSHLTGSVRPGERVVIYLTGHGSRVPDASQHEPDARDSSFLAYDSRLPDGLGQGDLTDDMLHTLLRELVEQKQARVTLITDFCHSLGSSRGAATAELVVRAVPFVDRAARARPCASWPSELRLLDDDESEALGPLPGLVEIAACGEDEESLEARTRSRSFGVFTQLLIAAISKAAPGTTWRQLQGSLAASTRQWNSRLAAKARARGAGAARLQPLPHVTGAIDVELFGQRRGRTPTGHACWVDSAGTLHVDAGRAQGLVPGVALQVRTMGGTPVGTAQVIDAASATDPQQSHANWHGDAPTGLFGRALWATISHRPSGLARLPLRCDAPTWLERLDNSPWWAAPTEDSEDPASILQLVAGPSDSARILDSRGIAMGTLDAGAANGPAGASVLAELARWQGLWSLAGRGGAGETGGSAADGSGLRVTIRSATHTELQRRNRVASGGPAWQTPALDADAPARDGLTVVSGNWRKGHSQLLTLQVDNESFTTLYLHAVCLFDDGRVYRCYPVLGHAMLHESGNRSTIAALEFDTAKVATALPAGRESRVRVLTVAAAAPIAPGQLHAALQGSGLDWLARAIELRLSTE